MTQTVADYQGDLLAAIEATGTFEEFKASFSKGRHNLVQDGLGFVYKRRKS
jgi:hypothetical protein